MAKMECRKVRELAGTTRMSEWTAEQKRMVAEHVKECSECRRFVAEMQLLARATAGLERPRAPEGLASAVAARIAARRRRGLLERLAEIFGPVPAWAPVAAGVAVLVLVAFGAVMIAGHIGPAGGGAAVSGQVSVASADQAFAELLVSLHRQVAGAEVLADPGVMMANGGAF